MAPAIPPPHVLVSAIFIITVTAILAAVNMTISDTTFSGVDGINGEKGEKEEGKETDVHLNFLLIYDKFKLETFHKIKFGTAYEFESLKVWHYFE